MAQKSLKNKTGGIPPIYIVSGGLGASGEQVVETVLVQFPDFNIPIFKMAHTRSIEQVEEIAAKASTAKATIVHTLVDKSLREALIRIGKEKDIVTIDLMGSIFERLTRVLGREPEEQPGLYRKLHKSYFDRIDAIEFAMVHDDGKNPQDLPLAEIVALLPATSTVFPKDSKSAVIVFVSRN